MLVPETAYNSPIRRLNSGIRGCTHLARVSLPGLSVAVVKAFPTSAGRCFFNEVAGGVLAQNAQIGAPPMGLIWINLDVLHGLFPGTAFDSEQGKVLCVMLAPVVNDHGLVALGAGDAFGDSQVLRDHLLGWGGLPVCTAFDQWVGNTDRHPNNVLVGGGLTLFPIDHSDCFLGPNWTADDMECPNVWANCRFHEVIPLDTWKLPTRHATIAQAGRWAAIFERSEVDLRAMSAWLPGMDGINWLQWVRARATLTEDLLKHRFGMIV